MSQYWRDGSKNGFAPHTKSTLRNALIPAFTFGRELSEFSLYHDLCRMGMCKEWFAAEYPKTVANSSQEACLQTGDSFRFFEHEAYQEIFPIPTNEILTNPLINQADQNPGY